MDTTASEMGVRSTGSGRPRKAAVMMGLGGGVGGQPDAIRVDPRLGARGRHPDVGALAGLGRRPLPHRSRRRFAPGRADAGDPPGAAVVGDRGEPRRHGDAVGRARHLALLNDLGRRLGGTLDLGTLAREMLLATEKLIPGARPTIFGIATTATSPAASWPAWGSAIRRRGRGRPSVRGRGLAGMAVASAETGVSLDLALLPRGDRAARSVRDPRLDRARERAITRRGPAGADPEAPRRHHRHDRADPEQREYLTLARSSSADPLLGVINEILDFSKIEAGRVELERVNFSLHDRVSHALKALGLDSHQKGLELAFEARLGVPDALEFCGGRFGVKREEGHGRPFDCLYLPMRRARRRAHRRDSTRRQPPGRSDRSHRGRQHREPAYPGRDAGSSGDQSHRGRKGRRRPPERDHGRESPAFLDLRMP